MAKTSTDATAAFFERLATRGHEPLLQSASGTLRLELKNGRRTQYWYVTIKKGDVAVSNANAEADAVLRTDKALADQMVTGRVNAMAATLRGAVQAEGDLGLVMSFQRLFPGPPGSRRRKA
jgi:putative sterol carrier protein